MKSIYPAFNGLVSACVLGVALLVGGTGVVRAHAFCVTTAAELQSALDNVSDGGMYSGETNFIDVVRGTYKTGAATGNAPFHLSSTDTVGDVLIYGGYAAGCLSSGRSHDPTLTVLDGQNNSAVMTISSKTSVEVYGFTIQNGSDHSGASAGGLSIITNGNAYALVQANIIRNNHTPTRAGGLYVNVLGTGYPMIFSNLIVGNSADQGYGAGTIIDNGTVGSISHNTIVHNTTIMAAKAGGLYYGGVDTFDYFIVGNILRANTFADLELGTIAVSFQYNDYGVRVHQPPNGNVGNLQLVPNFVDDAGGDYHLSAASPLLGAMPSHTNLLDIEGHRFPLNGKGDIGAYEETIFTNGFDG